MSRTQRQLLLAAFCLVWAVAAYAQDVVVKLEGTGYKLGSEAEPKGTKKALERAAKEVLESKFLYWFRAEDKHPQFWIILKITPELVENSEIRMGVMYNGEPISGRQETWRERLIQEESGFEPKFLHAIPRSAQAWEGPVRSSLKLLLRRNEEDIKTSLRKIPLGTTILHLPSDINPTSPFFYPVLNLRWDKEHKDFPLDQIFLLNIQAIDGPLTLEAVGTGEVRPTDPSNTAYGVEVRVDKFSNAFTYDLGAYKPFADIGQLRRIKKQPVRFVWYGGDVVVAPSPCSSCTH